MHLILTSTKMFTLFYLPILTVGILVCLHETIAVDINVERDAQLSTVNIFSRSFFSKSKNILLVSCCFVN